MADPLLQRYVKKHRNLVSTDREVVQESLSRFSNLYKRAEWWFSALLILSVTAGLLATTQLLGARFSAEVYGQKLSDLPENIFFCAALCGVAYFGSLVSGLNQLVYSSIMRWLSVELYGADYDIVFRSWLSIEHFGQLPSILKASAATAADRVAIVALWLCQAVFAAAALMLVFSPLAALIYFLVETGDSTTPLAVFEWWSIMVLTVSNAVLLLVGIGTLAAITEDD